MTLNIIPNTQPIPVDNISWLLYGTPGIGKTSIACSTKNSLLLDFDKGAHRSAHRSDAHRIDHWREVANIKEADLAAYDTVILDTVGRALDMLSLAIMENNPKTATSAGALTLQGWGELKATFAGWLRRMRLMQKDVLMVAHDKEEKRDELTVVRADIQGGSYAEIMKLSDSVAWHGPGGEFGYGVLDFNPTPEHSGKNPGQIQPIQVPDLHRNPKFLTTVTETIKNKLNEVGERGLEVARKVDEYREQIDGATTMKRINELVETANSIEDRAVQLQVKHLVNNRAKALGMVYDKTKKAFIKDKTKGDGGDEEQAPTAAAG